MKSKLHFLLLITLMLLLVLSGCEDSANKDPDGGTIPTGEVVDISGYTLIRSDTAEDEIVRIAMALRSSVEANCGYAPQLSTDFVKRGDPVPTDTAEIVVGETNRHDSLVGKCGDWSVERVGSRVYLLGTTPEAVNSAVEFFTNHFLVEGGMNMVDGYSYSYHEKHAVEKLTIGGAELDGLPIYAAVNTDTSELVDMIQSRVGYFAPTVKSEDDARIVITDRTDLGIAGDSWGISVRDGKLYIVGSTQKMLSRAVRWVCETLLASNGALDFSDGVLVSENAQTANSIFYVSASGSDDGDGTKAQPFKTITRAIEAARASAFPATVEVLAGTYHEILSFDERDSECTLITHENAVISGGISVAYADTLALSDEIKARLSPEAAEKVRAIDLNRYGIAPEAYSTVYSIGSYSTASKYDGYENGINIEVFENDSRMTLARYPNEGYLKLVSVPDQGDPAEYPAQNYTPGWSDRRNHSAGTYIIDEETNERVKAWKNPETAWMFGYFYWDWADASTPVASFDTESCAVNPMYVSRYGARSGALYYFYNVLEELDSPGEFYIDRDSGVLYVYADRKDSVFDISIENSPLISIKGADNMTVSGFTLTCTLETAVTVSGNDNHIDGLLIKNVANHGVTASGFRNIVENCEITHTGRGGIYLSGGDRATLTPGENRAENNYIHDFSEVYQTYQSGVSLSGVGNVCAHNEISGSPHMAVGYSGNEHLIEYNYIHDVVLQSSDAGAIYAGRDWAGHGTVIRYNLIRDIGSGSFTPIGIYWDDGLSGQTAYGNILINVGQIGLFSGGGRDNVMRDNIIIGESRNPICYDDRYRDGFVNGGWAHAGVDTPDATMWKTLQNVPYTSAIWAEKYPTLARVITDFSRYDDPDFPVNPANSVIENNIIINNDARLGSIAKSVYKYSNVGENYTYHSYEEAGLDPDTFRFTTEREGFEDLSIDEIGRK